MEGGFHDIRMKTALDYRAPMHFPWYVCNLGSNWNNTRKCGWYLNCNNGSGNRNRNISGQLLNVPKIHFLSNYKYYAGMEPLPLGKTGSSPVYAGER